MAEKCPPLLRKEAFDEDRRCHDIDDLTTGIENIAFTEDADKSASGKAEKSDTENMEKQATWAAGVDQIGATDSNKTDATNTDQTGGTNTDPTDATSTDQTETSDIDQTGAPGAGQTGVTNVSATTDIDKPAAGESEKETTVTKDGHETEDPDKAIDQNHNVAGRLELKFQNEREEFTSKRHFVSLTNGVTPNFTGVSLCEDGRVLLTDFSCVKGLGFVSFYEPVNRFRSEIALPCTFSAVQFDHYHIAVTLPKHRSIRIVRIGKEAYNCKEIKSNVFHGKPWTIAALSNGDLAVGWTEPVAFTILDPTSDKMATKVYMTQDNCGRKFESFGYFAVDENRRHVIQTCGVDQAVYCFTLGGDPVFRYGPVGLECPEGIALDRNGNIYVCDWAKTTIHKISPTGQPLNVFQDEVPPQPRAICQDLEGTGFWVTQSYQRDRLVHLKLITYKVPAAS